MTRPVLIVASDSRSGVRRASPINTVIIRRFQLGFHVSGGEVDQFKRVSGDGQLADIGRQYPGEMTRAESDLIVFRFNLMSR